MMAAALGVCSSNVSRALLSDPVRATDQDCGHQSLLCRGSGNLHSTSLKATTGRPLSKSSHKSHALFLSGIETVSKSHHLGGAQLANWTHRQHRLQALTTAASALPDENTPRNRHHLQNSPQQQTEPLQQQNPHVELVRETEPQQQAPLRRRQLILLASTAPLITLQPASTEALENLPAGLTLPPWKGNKQSVQLVIGNGCGLGVSIYPDFEYNAGGNGGIGTARKEADGRIFVEFDPATLQIPPVQFSTTKLLTLPLPPPLKIEIVPKKLEGYIEPQSGKVDLDFLAEFVFTIGPLYEAKPLVVGTRLTTESSQGPLRSGQGQRLGADGRCVLAGVARVAPVQDALLDPFLMLPTDCLAKLPAQFIFSS